MSQEKTVTLKNRMGNFLSLRLRPYRPGDEEGMIACIRDEYGETYFKTALYDPGYIRMEAEEGVITFLVAETEKDGIAGMMILKQFLPVETMCEIASQIFRKKYRGYGLAMSFFQYGMEILLSKSYSAAFCLPVVFHDVTQRLLYRLGLRATGFMLNVFDMDGITHSYQNGRNGKHSQGIQVRAVEKKDAGVLYLPEEHRLFCELIYDRLEVKYRMAEEMPEEPDGLPERSIVVCKNDERQHSMEIRIPQVGADLKEQLRMVHSRYPLEGKQTANILLNCNDLHAVWAYDLLKKEGYFFTGLKPLCSDMEFMVLHHPGKVKIYFSDYVVSEEFARLLRYIRSCYENRADLQELNSESGV